MTKQSQEFLLFHEIATRVLRLLAMTGWYPRNNTKKIRIGFYL
ncbi:hypothetical protein [Rickettsia hoogstraalii]|nr:hypothetical protein [Rickettsia hoogstraalii]